jgi:hypothetical protein
MPPIIDGNAAFTSVAISVAAGSGLNDLFLKLMRCVA